MNIQFLLMLIFCGGIGLFAYVWTDVHTPIINVSLVSDSLIDPVLQKRCAEIVNKGVRVGLTANDLLPILQQEAACVAALRIKRTAPGIFGVRIEYERPFIVLNGSDGETRVMTHRPRLVPTDHYRTDIVTQLPEIFVGGLLNQVSVDAIYVWAKQISLYFFTRYKVAWHKSTLCTYEDTQWPVVIATQASQKLSDELCDKVYRLVQTENKGLDAGSWRADVRFKGCVVVSPTIVQGENEEKIVAAEHAGGH